MKDDPVTLATHAERLDEALAYPDATWAYHQMLCRSDRDAMDCMLVNRQHPLAYRASTQESRFRDLHAAAYRFSRP